MRIITRSVPIVSNSLAGAGADQGSVAARSRISSGFTALIFAGAGVLLVSSAITARGTDLRADRFGDLRELTARQARNVDALAVQVDALTMRVADTARAGAQGPALVAQQEAAALAPAAGLTPMVGPMVSVALDDAPRLPNGQTRPGNPAPNDLVVHQQDVQSVVNALWKGGATGMSIMDQRIVSTSAVRCVGNTLLLGGRVYSPPFTIKAVGDQQGMLSSLESDPAIGIYREYVDLYGLGYDVSSARQGTLPTYTGSLPVAGAR